MIRYNDYKYIYNKRNKSEELYDLFHDPGENVNLLLEDVFNKNRDKNYFLEEVYYYPKWDDAHEAYKILREEKDRIWKTGNFHEELMFKLKNLKNKKFATFYKFLRSKNVVRGRWGSLAQEWFYEK